jgi:hypothetical protein
MEDFACLTELSVARHFTANHFGIGGYFHLNFEGAGLYHIPSNTWHSGGGMSEYWLTVPRVAREFVSWIHFRPGNPPRVLYERDFLPPQIIGWNNDWGQFEFRRTAIAVRCVKDE